MTKKVEFIWFKSRKIWEISGKGIDDITEKCMKLCYKYNAINFQILD